MNATPIRRHLAVLFLFLTLFPLYTGNCLAGHATNKVSDKKAILLVAFGTSIPEARTALDNIEQKARAALDGMEIRWAYTSSIVRSIIKKNQGLDIPSPAEAMAGLISDGYEAIAVQSLHSIPGQEFHELLRTVNGFRAMGQARIVVGSPLLSSHKDMLRARDALLAIAPKERTKNEALVFMGHGTHHPANVYYPAMQYFLSERDPLAFMGTVEGAPSLERVMHELAASGAGKVYLLPFMSVAGDHARNDMAGPEDDSWASVMEKAGYEVHPVLRGTARFDETSAIWLDHLKTAVRELDRV